MLENPDEIMHLWSLIGSRWFKNIDQSG